MTTPHDDFLNLLLSFKAAHPSLELPPKIFVEMKGEVVAYDVQGSLQVQFPFDDRFTNPTGVFQGGMLCTAIDNVFGPLAYFVAGKPTVTLDLSCKYIRPFTREDSPILITASVTSKTRQFLILEAEVKSKGGKLLAVANTHCLIVDGKS